MRPLLVFAVLLVAGTAQADELTAGDLYSFCTSNERVLSNACRFYILGVVQGVGLGDGTTMDASGKQMVERKKTIFCIPDDFSQSQMVGLVRDQLGLDFRAYPEDKNLAGVGMVAGVMRTKFPCTR